MKSSDHRMISQLGDHDLIFLSEKPQNLNFDQNPILAYVLAKAFPNKSGEFDSNCYVTLLVDKKAKIGRSMHCQKLEKLGSVLREYKTLRMCEFYRIAPLILNPKEFLKNKAQNMINHRAILSKIQLDKKKE
jgi:hypothetical protein